MLQSASWSQNQPRGTAPPDSIIPPQLRSSNGLSFHARPGPDCKAFLFTNAGGYLRLGSSNGGGLLRGIADWGAMVNVTPRNAVGGSWFVTADEDEFTMGPSLRYRRWFERGGSLDLSVGTPIANSDGDVKAGSVFALVKYNPVHWFGLAVRPEYLRRTEFSCTQTCTEYTSSSGRVYAGAEFGWYPGLFLTLGAGILVGFLVLVLLAAGY